MKKASNQKSKISTPKKVALAILGALTILTFVNLIEAGMKQNTHDAAAIYEEVEETEHAIAKMEEKYEDEHERDFSLDIDIDIDGKNIEVNTKAGKAFNARGEVVLDETFDVSDGELLSIEVSDADINIETHEGNNVQVMILLDAADMNKAREFFDNQNFDVLYDRGAVYIRTNPTKNNHSWDNHDVPNITIDIDVPAVFNADVKTLDGDIAISTLQGDVSLHTSDGDIMTDVLNGSILSLRTSDGDITSSNFNAEQINIRSSDGDIDVSNLIANNIMIDTSDGDIRGEELDGKTAVRTSDGDIVLFNIRGNEADLRTSDGEIRVEELITELSSVHTSDGSIFLKNVDGNLTAKSSSGDLHISLSNPTDVNLRTIDGDITVEAPKDYTATLFLKGDRVRFSPEFSYSGGDIKDDVVDIRINGGGHTFEARTSYGEVTFREN